MRNALTLICCLDCCAPQHRLRTFLPRGGERRAFGEASWYQALRTGLSQFRNGGGYETSREAMQALAEKACRWDPRTRRPVFFSVTPLPPFCSSACYLLLLKSLQIWDSAQPRPVISERAWLALIPRFGQHDGEGPWGWANANGPGLAVLVHRLGAGINFEDWRKARPGDFMKFSGRTASGAGNPPSDRPGEDGGDQVTFWSSNIPDGLRSQDGAQIPDQARHFHAHHQAGTVQPGPLRGKSPVAVLPAPAGSGHEGSAQAFRHAEPDRFP
ncbi:MAG: hypothetical protein ACLT38_04890 [Akkermansia sp.]